ncbi:hypothetical protein IKF92_02085 [Candidatus Saccharibacteria bacterium]|nr:hypothetical protein [Candidatus Saccharibacteria bacterium]
MPELTDHMATVQQEIQRYQSLKAQIEAVISELNSASSQVDNLNEGLDNAYLIDGNNAFDHTLVTGLKRKVEEVPLYLSGTVIPAIDEKIIALQGDSMHLQEAEISYQDEPQTSANRLDGNNNNKNN